MLKRQSYHSANYKYFLASEKVNREISTRQESDLNLKLQTRCLGDK